MLFRRLLGLAILGLSLGCNNPQSGTQYGFNSGSALMGKWQLINSSKFYTFNSNGTYDLLDTLHPADLSYCYTDQFSNYYEEYLNIVYHYPNNNLFNSDTTVLLDSTFQYQIARDTLFIERPCLVFSGKTTTLKGLWSQRPLRIYLVNHNYVYGGASDSIWMNFSSDGVFSTNANWGGPSYLPPYPYIDHQSFFTFRISPQAANTTTLDYNIQDTLLFLMLPPYLTGSAPSFKTDTLIRIY